MEDKTSLTLVSSTLSTSVSEQKEEIPQGLDHIPTTENSPKNSLINGILEQLNKWHNELIVSAIKLLIWHTSSFIIPECYCSPNTQKMQIF